MEELERIEERIGKRRKKRLIIGVGAVLLFLVAGGLVGSWLAGVGPLGAWQPGGQWQGQQWQGSLEDIPGYPSGPPAASGMVKQVTATTLDLEEAVGTGVYNFGPGGGGWEPGTETWIVQVVLSAETKVYKMVFSPHGKLEPGPPELEELSLADIEPGQLVHGIWGETSGDRIFADTIIIHHAM